MRCFTKNLRCTDPITPELEKGCSEKVNLRYSDSVYWGVPLGIVSRDLNDDKVKNLGIEVELSSWFL